MKARDVMTSPVTSFPIDTPVRVAAESLTSRGYAGAPVTDEDGNLVGTVTQADLCAPTPTAPPHRGMMHRHRHVEAAVVGDVMTTPVESMTPGADISDVVKMMLDEHAESITIVDGRTVVGIITPADLFPATNSATQTTQS